VETKYRLYATPARSRKETAESADAIRRRARRRPVFTCAALAFCDDLPAPLDCTVRDVSATGARLELDRVGLRKATVEVRLPDYCCLFFCPDRTEVDCRLAWQDGRHFGVQFLGAIRPSTRQSD
jgi:hypothetical protein